MKTIAPKLKILGGIIFCIVILSAFSMTKSEKITICHKGKHEITIPKSALLTHLAHGDRIEPCGMRVPD